MPALDRRSRSDSANHGNLLSAILIAPNDELRSRVIDVLEELGLKPSAVLDSPTSLSGKSVTESTIVLIVCDVDAPREVTALRRLRKLAAEIAIVVISQPTTGAAVRRVLDAGADALVFEPDLELTLAAAIRAVESGQSVVPRKLRASVQRPTLSHREQQVLTLVLDGLTNAEIADRLYLAESTVKSHLASVFTKFGVHSRKEAAAVFVDLALAPAGAPTAIGFEPARERATA